MKRATPQSNKTAQRAGDFNPRPREEGDDIIQEITWGEHNFNPRPREEGDLFENGRLAFATISIHALVKRATTVCAYIIIKINISIHALVKRATLKHIKIWDYLTLFQSTPS